MTASRDSIDIYARSGFSAGRQSFEAPKQRVLPAPETITGDKAPKKRQCSNFDLMQRRGRVAQHATQAHRPISYSFEPDTKGNEMASNIHATEVAAAIAEGIAEGQASGLTYALEIIELCTLAGFPERADGFLRAGTSVKAARALLQNAKADDADKFVTRGHISPVAHGDADANTGWDRAIAIAKGKT